MTETLEPVTDDVDPRLSGSAEPCPFPHRDLCAWCGQADGAVEPGGGGVSQLTQPSVVGGGEVRQHEFVHSRHRPQRAQVSNRRNSQPTLLAFGTPEGRSREMKPLQESRSNFNTPNTAPAVEKAQFCRQERSRARLNSSDVVLYAANAVSNPEDLSVLLRLVETGYLDLPTMQQPELVAHGFSSGFLRNGPPPPTPNAVELAEIILNHQHPRRAPTQTVVYELGAPYLWDLPILTWISTWARRHGAGTDFTFSD